MARKDVHYKSTDNVEVLELIDRATNRPVFTIFVLNRQIHKAYQYKINYTEKLVFRGEHTQCTNGWVAAGYELATQVHGREMNPKALPHKLRMMVLGSLPPRTTPIDTGSKGLPLVVTERTDGSEPFSPITQTNDTPPMEIPNDVAGSDV